MGFTFPFGEKVHQVVQVDRGPKEYFVLGVYASAVHAKWLNPEDKVLAKALAVASEPSIFWTGDGAEEIISRIKIPTAAGRLVTPAKNLNGPSGDALDERVLKPLNVTRDQVWLCDLLPESRMNPNQAKAIERAYLRLSENLNLPRATVPPFRKSEANTEARRAAILAELDESQAKTIIVLGDAPIQQFINPLVEQPIKNLDHLTKIAGAYGQPVTVTIGGRSVDLVGLCHPRQAGRLGHSSKKWGMIHDQWVSKRQRSSSQATSTQRL